MQSVLAFTGIVALVCSLVHECQLAEAWMENAQYAARLAVTLCRTDTECERAAAVADDYGVSDPIYLTEPNGWQRADFLRFE